MRQEPVLVRQLPVKRLALADGSERMVVSVYDLVLANYGLDRGLDDCHSANNYNDVKPTRRPGANRLPACRVDISKLLRVNLPRPPIKLTVVR